MKNRFGPKVILFPTAQIRARLAADERARRKRTIVVGQPWGWLWWPGDRNPVTTDPDIDDGRRTPRAISTMHVDWLLVLHAARYAVSRLPTDATSLLALPEVAVRVPIPLTDEEHILAQSWVGPASPVTYWYEQDIVQDGRHRLWLTRDHQPRYQLPVFSTNLAYLADARGPDPCPCHSPRSPVRPGMVERSRRPPMRDRLHTPPCPHRGRDGADGRITEHRSRTGMIRRA